MNTDRDHSSIREALHRTLIDAVPIVIWFVLGAACLIAVLGIMTLATHIVELAPPPFSSRPGGAP